MGSSDFRNLNDSELSRLSDDGLITHIRAASDAGEPVQAKRALQILVFRYAEDVRRRVSMKVPAADVDDVAQEALMSAITSAFNGKSKGEFHAWLNRIVSRRIADYHRKKEKDPNFKPLVSEHEGDEDLWGESPESLEPDAAEIDTRMVIAEVLEEFNEVHQVVIIKYCYQHAPAAEVAEEITKLFTDLEPTMSENNVQKIGSRFRERLRERLAKDDNSS